MNKVFNKYSEYYDLIYSDKDYQREVNFIHELIQKFYPNANSILDLGCGTGMHANLLAAKGYKVTGVDISKNMISIANTNLLTTYYKNVNRLSFQVGDIRCVRLEQKYDVVISLFHVLSYLNTNNDVLSGMQTIKFHLKPNGISIFDFWYGPGVLTDLPQIKVKRLENENLSLVRIAEPNHFGNENIVEVKFQLFIHDKTNSSDYSFYETHSMRYFFKPELDNFISMSNMGENLLLKWLENIPPSLNTWNALMVCKNGVNIIAQDRF